MSRAVRRNARAPGAVAVVKPPFSPLGCRPVAQQSSRLKYLVQKRGRDPRGARKSRVGGQRRGGGGEAQPRLKVVMAGRGQGGKLEMEKK